MKNPAIKKKCGITDLKENNKKISVLACECKTGAVTSAANLSDGVSLEYFIKPPSSASAVC